MSFVIDLSNSNSFLIKTWTWYSGIKVCQHNFSRTCVHMHSCISCCKNNKNLMLCLRTQLRGNCLKIWHFPIYILLIAVASNTFNTWQPIVLPYIFPFMFLSLPYTTATFSSNILLSTFPTLPPPYVLYLPLLIHEYLQIVRN